MKNCAKHTQMYKKYKNNLLIGQNSHKNELYFNLNIAYNMWIICRAMYIVTNSKEFIFNI